MATRDKTTEFGQVSRLKGVLFEKLTFGASLFGILALAVLLIYVFVDAFDLANATPEWLLAYFCTLVLPFLAFCLYTASDPAVTRRALSILGAGLVITALVVTGVEQFVRPIPDLNWQLTYLFVVVTPVAGYLTYVSSRTDAGSVGFGLLGRLAGGAALGIAVHLLFFAFDEYLWVLAYTLGLLPAGAAYAYGRVRDRSRLVPLAVPIAVVGCLVAVVLRSVLTTYPTLPLIYVWTIALPLGAIAAVTVASRGGSRRGSGVVGAIVVVAALAGLGSGALGLSSAPVVVVLATTAAATATFVYETVDRRAGYSGVALPVLLIGGSLAGAFVTASLGIQGPDPWLDYSYVTNAPSSTAVDAGLFPAIVGSVIIIAMVAVISFVLGVGTAVFLEEYTSNSGLVGAVTRIIQVNIANLAAVPSVVYGLLGLGLFANLLGFGFGTAVTASLTLSLLILPITVVSAQEAIRSVPEDLRRGSDAMGATRWQTTKNVVLPEALPGILTGTILALGRAIGETAPLIMIGAATTVFSAPTSVWSKFTAMPMQIFAWSDFPQEEFRYGVVAAGVVTLLIVLIGMNATAIVLRNRTESGV